MKRGTIAIHEVAWHACSDEETQQRLQSSLQGLEQIDFEERLREYGKNVLPGKKAPSLFQVVLHQFKSPLISILLIAGVASLLMKDIKDAVFIFAVIVLNAIIGTMQEWRAEKSAHALQSLLKIQARVRRAGGTEVVPAEEIVPGDVVLIESGDKVPADIRLIQVNSLAVDESFLTGESLPVQKDTGILPEQMPVSDRTNMAFAGATVMTGRGTGLVVATGSRTEVGKVARSITEIESAKPPLVIRMERFSRQIGIGVLVFAAMLGTLSVMRGMGFEDVFLVMVAMAVSAIPEGLPVAMTVALSLATSRMTTRKVIARRLVAVESLGSCTVIATDKTGTLTVNQQTVKLIVLPDGTRVDIGGQGYNDEGTIRVEGDTVKGELKAHLLDIGRAAVLCNEGTLSEVDDKWVHSGDSMDVALLALGYKLGISPEEMRTQNPVIAEMPFESEKRYAAAAYRTESGVRIAVKGAIETVVPFCTRIRTTAGESPLDKESLLRQTEEMAGNGYRVLLIAEGSLPDADNLKNLDASHLKDLTLLGLLGFMDPLRPEVKEAVSRAKGAGVKVVMITGDHPATALAIARELEIAVSEEQAFTGAEMTECAEYDTPEFHSRLKKITVFARVTPEQKLCIVDTLMRLGEFVAVTGDGVNDAPALNRANIGVAMGSGTEVAKDASQIIVTDDNFASIVNGIEEGRYAYANVRKVTLFLISTGFAELILIGAAIMLNMPVPFLAVQLLWLNLVTNGIQDVALAFEAGEKGVMALPPRRPTEGIFNRKMIEQVLVGGMTMALVCLIAWRYLLGSGMEVAEARNNLLTLMILMQFYHVVNCRSEYLSAFRIPLRNNKILIMGMIVAFAIHLLATHLPLTQSLLRVVPLSIEKWLILGSIASVLFVVMECYKKVRHGEQGEQFGI